MTYTLTKTGAQIDAIHTKVDGIEASADVTDATNVTAAGALMDSEVADLAGIKTVVISTLQVKPSEGAFDDGDKTKLDGIEAGADVTDATNVTAAGALMDSEVTNLAQVKAFDSTDYATAAQGTTADSALQPGDNATELNGTAHRVLYIDASGDVTELALGADGTFLKSNGATSAPSFATPAGSGDVSKVGTPVNNQIGVWTGDGTLEGDANFTWSGTVLAVTGDITATNFGDASSADLTKLSELTATSTELNYVDGVTSAIQTQLNDKAPLADPTFTGEIGIGAVNVSETELGILEGATLSTTELNYVDGVTSSIQTQLDSKTDDEITLEDQTGTTYTLVLTDKSKLVTLSNASAITMTVPPNSSVAFPVGTQILLYNKGAGQVTVAEGSGVTINTSSTLLMRAQYSMATLIKIATDEWIISGDLEAA